MKPSVAFKEWLSGLQIMEPAQRGSLQVFGLRKPSGESTLSYLTLGEDVRVVSDAYAGGALVVDEQPVHAELFSVVE